MSDPRLIDRFRGLSTLTLLALMLQMVGGVFGLVALGRALHGDVPIALVFTGLAVLALGQAVAWRARRTPGPR